MANLKGGTTIGGQLALNTSNSINRWYDER
jgi:hypothetical protein